MTYASSDHIARVIVYETIFEHLERTFAVRYSEMLREKPRGGRAVDALRPKGAFIEGLHDSILFSMRIYKCANEDASFYNLAQRAKVLPQLEESC